MNAPLTFLILLPLLGILGILFRLPVRITAILTTAAVMFLTALIWVNFKTDGTVQFQEAYSWMLMPGLGHVWLRLAIDGINLPLVFLTSIVGFAAVMIAPQNVEREREYYCCILTIIAGALGAFLSFDLFFFYVFHELALIPTFLMIGIWGNGARREFVTYQVAIYLILGSLVLLAGILALLYSIPVAERTTNMLVLRDYFTRAPLSLADQKVAYPLLLLGFGILVGLFPFHTWAPRAYAAAPTPAAMLHAGVLKKFGVYGLLRVAQTFLPAGSLDFSQIFFWLIVCNILVIAWVTLAQKNLPELLGYSSVMHMGYLFLGILAFTDKSLTGVTVLMTAHGLSVAGLFAVNGMIGERTGGTLTLTKLGGLAQKYPYLSFLFVLFSMASLGLPGLGNFAGEILIFFGSWEKQPLLVIVALFGVLLTTIYSLRALKMVFFGEINPALELKEGDANFSQGVACAILAGCLLAIGLYPTLVAGPASHAILPWIAKP